jgi:D-alanine-D-alanine ligase
MPKPIRVVLLYGGKSGEHEISLISAASVLANLDPERYQIIPVGMDKEGQCFVNDYQTLLAFEEALPVKSTDAKPLDSLLFQGKLAIDADVVFPVVHGPLYEDGCLQGVLELAGVAYVGCSVLASALGMDKDIARRLACIDGVQAAPYRRFSWTNHQESLDRFCRDTVAALGWPLFVKPCAMGSSVGIHKVNSMTELAAAITDARRYDEDILVEAFAQGREIELAVLENTVASAPPRVSVPGEICVNHPDGFYSYTAKYLESEQTNLEVPARLDAPMVSRLQQMAADIFVRLKCQGMARVDFFVDDQQGLVYFNEINTLPGFTPISMYPRMWQASGVSYPALLDQLIELAMTRRARRNQLVTHYK